MSLKKFLNNIEVYIASVFFAIMLVVIVIQIVTRVAGHPINWAEEAARYLMIWGCCMGVSAGVKNRSHVSIDSIVDHLPFKASAGIRIVMDAIEVAILLFVFIYGCKFTYMAYLSKQVMPAIQKPIWIVYLAFPVSFGFAVYRQVVALIKAIKDPASRCGIVKEAEK